MRFIIATHNRNKLKEIKEILSDLDLDVCSADELGFTEEAEETGSSFAENALIKASAVKEAFPDDYVMADDSGLEVFALNNQPGIYSARFAGRDSSYDVKIAKLQEMLEESGIPDRGAAFRCALAVIRPDGTHFISEGTLNGEIGYNQRGRHGFGYDPVFYLPAYGKTVAELDPAVKNEISHRALALRLMKETLVRELGR